MRKAAVVAITLFLGLATASAAADWTRVRIATEGAYPPWNATDSSGQLVGFELDLARDLCARMAVECEIVVQPWEGIIPSLTGGRYDAVMAGMAITEARQEVIRFSDSYAATPAYFAVVKAADLAAYQDPLARANLDQIDAAERVAIDDLRKAFAGKTVGVQVATAHADFIRALLGDVVEVKKYDTQESRDLDLEDGKLDLALDSMSHWQPLLETGTPFTLIGPGLTGGPFGVGVGVGLRKEDIELAELFNQAIAAARADGTLARLAQEWFGFDASSY